MRIRTDNLMHRIDRTWLGPKILRFPWTATYTAYGLGAIIMSGTALAGIKLGIPINIFSVMAWLVISIVLTSRIAKSLNPERPIRAALLRLWHELTAPRPIPDEQRQQVGTLVLSASRWRYGAQPERRRLIRWGLAARNAAGHLMSAVTMQLTGIIAGVGRSIRQSTPSPTKTRAAKQNRLQPSRIQPDVVEEAQEGIRHDNDHEQQQPVDTTAA